MMDENSTLPTASNNSFTKAKLNAQLIGAARTGQTDRVISLIAKGADINAAVAFSGKTVLILAAQKGHASVVSALLSHHNSVSLNAADKEGYTALILAALHGHVAVISALAPHLDAAALNAVNQRGNTALILAALHGHVAIISVLASHLDSAALNAVNQYGNTALILAAKNGHAAVVSALIPRLDVAALNKADHFGNTALMLAAENGHAAVISALAPHLNAAALNAENHFGFTALIMAAAHGHAAVVFRLLSAMPFQGVLALQQAHPNGRLGTFATQCRQAVLDIQREIFGFLRNLRLIPALANGPLNLVISYSCLFPPWYQHRAHRDIKLMSVKLTQMLANRAVRAPAPAAQLPLPLHFPLAPATPTFLPTREMREITAQTRALQIDSMDAIATDASKPEQDLSKKVR